MQGYPYERRKTPYKPSRTKGKQRALEDREFERELAWVRRKVAAEEGKQVGEKIEKEADEQEADTEEEGLQSESEPEEGPEEESDGEDEENGIECGCCFSKFRFVRLVFFSIPDFAMYISYLGKNDPMPRRSPFLLLLPPCLCVHSPRHAQPKHNLHVPIHLHPPLPLIPTPTCPPPKDLRPLRTSRSS